MMTKTNKILLVLAVLAVLVGGWMYYNSTRDANEIAGTEQNPDGTTNTDTPSNGIASIREIMSAGGTLKCVYTDDNNQRFTAYVKGSNVRTTIENPKSTTSPSNFIMQGQTMYMWPSGSTNQGLKLTVDANASKKAQEQTQGANNADKATNTDLVGALETYKNNCERTSVEDSWFEVPTNIKFQDFSQFYR